MTKEQRALAIAARAKLKKYRPAYACADGCPGWFVGESGMYGLMVMACDACASQMSDPSDRLSDEEAAALPEAQKLLREEAKAEGVEPCGNDELYGAVWT